MSAEHKVEQVCAHCGTRNRIPIHRIHDNPVCGRCKVPLFPRQPVVATDATFAEQVEASAIPVLVDFWAPWCGPCRMVAPALEQLAQEHAGRLKVVKLNTDDNPQVAARFAIRSIPAMKLFRDGRVVEELVGAMPKQAIAARISPHL